MKNLILVAVLFYVGSSFANAGLLDGKSYCRTVVTEGLFGQPAGAQSHCITFAAGVAIDNANTFFGNPPERMPYTLDGSNVIFGSSKYTTSEDLNSLTEISGSANEGTVFEIKK